MHAGRLAPAADRHRTTAPVVERRRRASLPGDAAPSRSCRRAPLRWPARPPSTFSRSSPATCSSSPPIGSPPRSTPESSATCTRGSQAKPAAPRRRRRGARTRSHRLARQPRLDAAHRRQRLGQPRGPPRLGEPLHGARLHRPRRGPQHRAPPPAGAERATWIGRNAEARDLAVFSVSDAYAEVRSQMGV